MASRRHARAEREVLVTSGAVGSPKLLLLSGIGPADELRALGIEPVHDLPGVGRNFQDHIDVYVISELNGPHSYNKHTRPHRQLWCAAQYYAVRQRADHLEPRRGRRLLVRRPEPRARPTSSSISCRARGSRPASSKLGEHGCTLNSCFLRPKSRGTVKLRERRSVRSAR